jgi:hypothetical protein
MGIVILLEWNLCLDAYRKLLELMNEILRSGSCNVIKLSSSSSLAQQPFVSPGLPQDF